MSQYDKTIEVKTSFQCGNGSAADGIEESLDGVRDIKAFKVIEILNTNGTAVALLIGHDGITAAYKLPQGSRLELEIRDPAKMRVAGDGGAVTYSWLAY